MTDVLETREFYEMCQAYRHSVMGGVEFEELKRWIRAHAMVDERLSSPIYEEDKQ